VVARTLLIVAVVLALRLPFLNQAVQGDDVLYLEEAAHTQIEPLHPMHFKELYLGQWLDMRGQSHPPLDGWILGALLAVSGTVREVPFHLAYTLFSLMAAMAMWSLARRFSEKPLIATLIFCAVPAFVINGNSLETDVPFLALWMAAIALFVRAVDSGSMLALAGSAAAAALSGLIAYQSVLLTPVLAAYLWTQRKRWTPAWIATLAAPAALAGWQLFEFASTGTMPALVLAGYLRSFHFESQAAKSRAAVALIAHLGWVASPLVALSLLRKAGNWRWILAGLAAAIAAVFDPNPLFWISIGCGIWWLAFSVQKGFLGWWILIFFAGAVGVFFAPSARYLLPIAAPVAILAADAVSPRIAAIAIPLQFALSIALATVNYQHWDGYRTFARGLQNQSAARRVWINSELGFRHYLEEDGGLPMALGQTIQAGDMVVSSSLFGPLPVAATIAPLAQAEVTSAIPLRLISVGGRASYSGLSLGLLPFEISSRPIDTVRAGIAVEPKLSFIDPTDPQALPQMIEGLFPDGWMSREAKVLLKTPDTPQPLDVTLYVAPVSVARHVRLAVDGRTVLEKDLPAPGVYTLSAEPTPGAQSVLVTITVDKTFTAPPDVRELGVKINGVGFLPQSH
jgi:hypothetical protein